MEHIIGIIIAIVSSGLLLVPLWNFIMSIKSNDPSREAYLREKERLKERLKNKTMLVLSCVLLSSCASGIRINGIQVKSTQTRKLQPRDVAVIAGLCVVGIHVGHTNNLNKKP